MRRLVTVSGGLDSAVLLADQVEKAGRDRVVGLFIDLGQRTRRQERRAARAVASVHGVPLRELRVGSVGRYLNLPRIVPRDPDTAFVANRDILIAGIAGVVAVHEQLDLIAIGSVGTDYHPAHRPEFLDALNRASDLANEGYWQPQIIAPLLGMRKADVAAAAGPEASLTWTCWDRQRPVCFDCSTCKSRLDGFAEAGIPDPLDPRCQPSTLRPTWRYLGGRTL